jgi:hypothetical protein
MATNGSQMTFNANSGTSSFRGTRMLKAAASGWGYAWTAGAAANNGDPFLPGNSTGRWYLYIRFAITYVPGLPLPSTFNAGIFGNAFNATVPTALGMGVVGGLSTSKYAIRGDGGGSSCLSSVNLDVGTFHEHKAWRDSNTTTKYSVDGETPVSGNTYPINTSSITFGMNDSSSNAGSIYVQEWFAATALPATPTAAF